MGPSHRARAGKEVGYLRQVWLRFARRRRREADAANDDAGCARDAHRGCCLLGRSACKTASSVFVRRKTSGWFGRSSFSGDYRLRPAPCGDFRLILVRDLRGVKRSRRSLCQIRQFAGLYGSDGTRTRDLRRDRCGPAVAPEAASARLSGDDFRRLLPVCCPRRSRTACDRLHHGAPKRLHPASSVMTTSVGVGGAVRIPEGPHPPLAMM